MKTSTASGDTSSTNAKHWVGVEAPDIPPGWMDDMVRRLFDILNRDLIRLEGWQSQESDKPDATGRQKEVTIADLERRARLVRHMQTSMQRLRAMEDAGVKKRKPKPVKSDEQAIQELERRIDQLIASNGNTSGPNGSNT